MSEPRRLPSLRTQRRRAAEERALLLEQLDELGGALTARGLWPSPETPRPERPDAMVSGDNLLVAAKWIVGRASVALEKTEEAP